MEDFNLKPQTCIAIDMDRVVSYVIDNGTVTDIEIKGFTLFFDFNLNSYSITLERDFKSDMELYRCVLYVDRVIDLVPDNTYLVITMDSLGVSEMFIDCSFQNNKFISITSKVPPIFKKPC